MIYMVFHINDLENHVFSSHGHSPYSPLATAQFSNLPDVYKLFSGLFLKHYNVLMQNPKDFCVLQIWSRFTSFDSTIKGINCSRRHFWENSRFADFRHFCWFLVQKSTFLYIAQNWLIFFCWYFAWS